MATAIEYVLISAGISAAIITVVQGLSNTTKWDGDIDKKTAAQACARRPADTTQVVIRTWLDRNETYECSNWPSLFYPKYVGPVYIDRSKK